MLVEMKVTQQGSPDGITVVLYEKGIKYDIPDRLAEIFLNEGWAKKVNSTKEIIPEETK